MKRKQQTQLEPLAGANKSFKMGKMMDFPSITPLRLCFAAACFIVLGLLLKGIVGGMVIVVSTGIIVCSIMMDNINKSFKQ